MNDRDEGDELAPFHSSFVDETADASVAYDDEALDIFALCFTLIKILFLLPGTGWKVRIRRQIPLLIHRVEPARRRSTVPLHETLIRNEHAYYLAIGQLLAAESAPETPRLTAPATTATPLYVCGDSHVLPLSWRSLSLCNGCNYHTIPKLVTGIKHWHLRDVDSAVERPFYPQRHFYDVVDTIPSASHVRLRPRLPTARNCSVSVDPLCLGRN